MKASVWWRTVLGVLAGLFLYGTPCAAQSEVGTVASVVGTFEVQRGSAQTWQAVVVGAPILLSDRLRTGPDAAAKVVLRDDSVIDMAAEAQLTIERFAVAGDAQRARSLLKLGKGTLRVLQGDTDRAGGRYEVETRTAIVDARVPAFVVRYDASEEFTDVVGVEGTVEVLGTIGVIEAGVQVGPQQVTRVTKGRLPTPPEALTSERFAAFQHGLVIVGSGRRETLDVGHPVIAGRLLGADDRPGAEARRQPSRGSYLRPEAYGEGVADRYSRDLEAQAQPIQEFRLEIPGEVPPP